MYRRSRQWESYLWEPPSSSKTYLIPKVLSHNRLSCCLPLWKGFGIVSHSPRVYARRAATVGTELPSRICGGIAQPNIGMAISTECSCVLCARRDFTAINMTKMQSRDVRWDAPEPMPEISFSNDSSNSGTSIDLSEFSRISEQSCDPLPNFKTIDPFSHSHNVTSTDFAAQMKSTNSAIDPKLQTLDPSGGAADPMQSLPLRFAHGPPLSFVSTAFLPLTPVLLFARVCVLD